MSHSLNATEATHGYRQIGALRDALRAVLKSIWGTERVEVNSQYAVEWFAILYEALTTIREGQTWNCEGPYADRFEMG